MGYLDRLNDQQLEAVTYEGGPLLILAGAGSGKTRVITSRIAYLIEHLGISPYSILAVTFTNKAAGEMKERVLGLVPYGENVMIKTFHSFGAWFLRRNGEGIGLKSNFTIYDDSDINALLKTLMSGATRTEIKQFARDISKCKDNNLTYSDNLYSVNPSPDFADVFSKYEKRLREIGNVDFGDLISLSNKILTENRGVRERLQSRFKVILVDEYQDSNMTQFALLKNLTGKDSWIGVVGDDDQSIYGFRGAEVKNILGFDKVFPNTKIIKLEENYRSTGNILSIASAVVENNINRLKKTLWTSKGLGEKPVIKYLDDGETEARFVGEKLLDGRLNETAVLYRTNAQSRAFESNFTRMGINYKIIGSLRFYEREEIKDILGVLSFLSNYNDEIAFRRIINKPPRGIGKKSLEKIITTARDYDNNYYITLKKISTLNGKALKGCKEFLGLINKFSNLDYSENLGVFIRKVIEDTGLLTYHRTQDEAIGSGKVENLEELVNGAMKYRGEHALSNFLESVELNQSFSNNDDNSDKVTLITMHNTKGLEFDRVFITGMENGLFPRTEKLENPMELEEERRLFYVSITRAREELYFTSCFKRYLHGRLLISEPSVFLDEIPSKSVIVKKVNNIHSMFKHEDAFDEDKSSDVGSEFKPGDEVYHCDYGSGFIVKIINNGKHNLALVRFETGLVKQFIPEFSGLEKILG